MSLRVGWNFGSTVEDERQDVIMQDPPCWTATSAVLTAGRGLSSWLFSNLSPPLSPSFPSFFCKESFTPRQPTSSCFPKAPPSSASFSGPVRSFINNLPQELLEEIFLEYLYGRTATSPSPNLLRGSFRRITTATGVKTTPFTLAHVCSTWRAVAMSNASLWSTLCAFQPQPSDISLFECWLSLSSTCPLDITIVEGGRVDVGTIDAATYTLLGAVLRQSNRWRNVKFRLGHDMESLLSSPPFYPSFPLLEALDIDLIDWTAEGSLAVSRSISASPNLRRMSWGNMCHIAPFIPSTPWMVLRCVHFGHVNLLDLSTILPLTTSLESLSIKFLQTDRTVPCFPHVSSHIQLPLLSFLSLSHYDDILPLLNILSLPSLVTLILETGFGSNAIPTTSWPALADLVSRSQCHVTSLHWSDNFASEDISIDFFAQSTASFPQLRDLLVGSPVSSKAVEAFTWRCGDAPSLFPSLQSLELRDCTSDRHCLQTMVSSRPHLLKARFRVWDDDGAANCLLLDASVLK